MIDYPEDKIQNDGTLNVLFENCQRQHRMLSQASHVSMLHLNSNNNDTLQNINMVRIIVEPIIYWKLINITSDHLNVACSPLSRMIQVHSMI